MLKTSVQRQQSINEEYILCLHRVFTALNSNKTGFRTSGDARMVMPIEVANKKGLIVTNNDGKVDVFTISPKVDKESSL